MVQFEEMMSYVFGAFSVVFAVTVAIGYGEAVRLLESFGVEVPVEVRIGLLLTYLLFGFLGLSQILLGLLHRRVAELEVGIDMVLRSLPEKPRP